MGEKLRPVPTVKPSPRKVLLLGCPDHTDAHEKGEEQPARAGLLDKKNCEKSLNSREVTTKITPDVKQLAEK